MPPDIAPRSPGPPGSQESAIDIARVFAAEGRCEPPCGGRTRPGSQAVPATLHAGVGAEDCDVYHAVELADGRGFPGAWDLRGHEEAYHLDGDGGRQSGLRSFARLRDSRWVHQGGFDAAAIHAEIYDPPPDLDPFDDAVLGAILLHLSHRFLALHGPRREPVSCCCRPVRA